MVSGVSFVLLRILENIAIVEYDSPQVGGTGKSFLIGTLSDAIRVKYGEQAVAICATTGIAAYGIGRNLINTIPAL